MIAICHTFYSLQTGVRSPQDWVQAAIQRGYTALALADINGLYGAVEFYQAATEAGLKPIIGAQLVLPNGTASTVLATSAKGYQNLCQLLSARHLTHNFQLEPYAAEADLADLLFLTHSSYMVQYLMRVTPRQNLFTLPTGSSENPLWDTVSANIPRADIPDAWFIDDKSDRETFAILARLRSLSGPRSMPISTDYPGAVLPGTETWYAQYPRGQIMAEIEERCQLELELGKPRLPKVSLPTGVTAAEQLRQTCYAALPRKYSDARKTQANMRLRRELDVIIASGFADYFLYVYEIVRFARSRNIPVEVRGSAASSIVSYLLAFTHCCPLEHDLYFERFMNPGRRDCPDIDIDIADNRRDEVIDFCYKRWGADRVAMVATILKYRSRSAIRDTGRVLGYSPAAVSAILEDDTAGNNKHRALFKMADRLTGLPRHIGVHCGGLVITPFPLTNLTPLRRSSKGVVITHFEKDQAEAIGLVKMDILGNSSLSVIEESRKSLWERGVVFAEPGPRYDYKVNRLFAVGDTLGVYQCESPGMRQLCRALKPKTPKQAAAALSLIRPGPAAAGMKDVFIRRQRGLEPVTYMHPRMAEFLDQTYGVMLYQEDVMKVAVKLAGYTLADADNLRRAVKQRHSAVFRQEKKRFMLQKAPHQGVDAATAEKLWDQVSRFASYSYCKAHASVYGRLAWLTARLKAHFPAEFYAALLNCHKSMYPKRVFVWDALRHGIPVLAPEINSSALNWQPTSRGVRAGLGIIRGLRQSVIKEIVAARHQTSFRTLADLRQRIRFRSGELERLILAGACRSLGERKTLYGRLQQAAANYQQPALFNDLTQVEIPDQLEAEMVITGIPFSRHPVSSAPPEICRAEEMNQHVKCKVWMLGILDAVKITRTTENRETGKQAREMSFATLEDETGLFELVLFPDEHDRYATVFRDIGPYLVCGIITTQWDSVTLEVNYVECYKNSPTAGNVTHNPGLLYHSPLENTG